MKKILIFFTCFIFLNLNAVAEIYYGKEKLNDYQINFLDSSEACWALEDEKHHYTIKFRLADYDYSETDKCLMKYYKLFYESFDSVQEKYNYYWYHYARQFYGYTLVEYGNKKQAREGLNLLEAAFNDPIYEMYPELIGTKKYVGQSLAWFYNIAIGNRDYEKALKYINNCIDSKDDSRHYKEYCINNLGTFYDQGYAVKRNYKKAFQLYSKSADMGNHWAQSNLVKFYLFGLGGVEKSYDKAIRHAKLSRISDLGDDDFTDLMILYNKGKLPKNIKEYMQWIKEFAINNQDGHGFQNLAWLAKDELSNQKNNESVIESYKWHYLASKYSPDLNDRQRSPQEMDRLETEVLSEKQIIEAIKRANQWIEKNWKN